MILTAPVPCKGDPHTGTIAVEWEDAPHTGTIAVEWEDAPACLKTSEIVLPSFSTLSSPVAVAYGTTTVSLASSYNPIPPEDVPETARVGVPFVLSYAVRNTLCGRVLDVGVSVDLTDEFVFAGVKHAKLKLLPGAVHELHYHLWPLVVGKVALPHFRVAVASEQEEGGGGDAGGKSGVVGHTRSPVRMYIQP